MNNIEEAGLKVHPFRFEQDGLRALTAREHKNNVEVKNT